MNLEHAICQSIAAVTGGPGKPGRGQGMAGGCINRAQRLECDGVAYFVKLNQAALLPMFEAEAQGLRELAGPRTLRVPQPVSWGSEGDTAWLVMEYLELGGRGSMAELGEGLAALHRAPQIRFGWSRDNTIGSTPQCNSPSDSWLDFWRDRRLGFQLELAARNGFGGRLQALGAELLERFPALFEGYHPVPSLLHGDLWSGNYSFTRAGEPVIFDPAPYCGDREADLAMTELFGGFGGEFYAAYQRAWPLDTGYAQRKTLYNLYHILNHANLFGGGYANQAQGMMERLLREL
ncbi:MAG TPA: fructosamine kinase family protein [Gammaproteobacteria bacterium]|nr:fructosamine kinase family protein [Gammaproteobacteria bacterium]